LMSPFKPARTIIQPSFFTIASRSRSVFCPYCPLFHCDMFWQT
jgi:hypothetical protein